MVSLMKRVKRPDGKGRMTDCVRIVVWIDRRVNRKLRAYMDRRRLSNYCLSATVERLLIAGMEDD